MSQDPDVDDVAGALQVSISLLRRRLRQAGRKPSARAYDAMIAATAIPGGLPVYTCNPADFTSIDGLTVVAVPVPQQARAASAPGKRAQLARRRRGNRASGPRAG